MIQIERLRELANKKRLTAEDKAEIEAEATAAGMTLKRGCPDCFRDAVVELYSRAEKTQQNANSEKITVAGYRLQDDTDLILQRGGRRWRVCAATMTAESVQEWIANGLDMRHFAETPETHESNANNGENTIQQAATD